MSSELTLDASRDEAVPRQPEAAIWQEVECGHYTADLAQWEALSRPGARVLELGCGSGRVALHLAGLGREVWGLDHDPALLAELGDRAVSLGLELRSELGDATAFSLNQRFDAILAPMQLANVIGAGGPRRMLRSASAHLAPGGVLALSLLAGSDVDDLVGAGRLTYDALPDVRKLDGWVYSSRPVDAELVSSSLVVRRVREVVSPAGDLRERVHEDRFELFELEHFERDAADVGLIQQRQSQVPPTSTDTGSSVLVFERAEVARSRRSESDARSKATPVSADGAA
jgi:SAM-dependent methyltransferase